MITTIFAILIIYLIFRVLRNITVYTMRSGPGAADFRKEPSKADNPSPKQTKIISKDEGEYVDYEEIKK
jgi:hypothetical protein